MTRVAIEDNPLFSVSDLELKREGRSYTVITIQELKKLYPDSELYLLGGSDILDEINTWRELEKIFELIKVVIGIRPGFNKINKENEFLKKSIVYPINALEISSSQIREKVKKNESIRYLVSPKVEEFIRAKGLYKK
jgi:nicotinate-nucleotide adenylyltransferase